jgi:glucosylceramidase
MEYLFGQDGLRFTWGRIPVGASDYALDRYTLNEENNDYDMSSFSIQRDLQSLIPYIQAAQDVKRDLRFWGSPWTPPTWMKDNGSYDHGNMKSDAQTLQAHALYLQKWVEAYDEQGIHIDWIMPQNEPGYSQDYPSCLWSAQTMTTYIADYLGPLFAEQVPETEVWLGTMSNPNDSQIVTSVMGNETARGYVKGLALQWGMEASAAQYDTQYTDIPMIQSEHKCGNYPWDAGTDQSRAPNDDAYARESWTNIHSWITKGVHAYLAWNMVLDPIGRSLDTVRPWAQNALITVDPNTKQVVRTPTYYVFQHLSYFVDPGAKRIGTSGSFSDALAFKNPDGSIVAVLYNGNGSARQTTLAAGTTTVSFSVPAQGWATVNLEP